MTDVVPYVFQDYTPGGPPQPILASQLNQNFEALIGLIEQSGGAATLALTLTGGTTLTTDQAVNNGYVFTGTLSVATSVSWPAYSGFLFVKNNTNQSLICGVLNRGFTVTILAGESVPIWSDGNNFFRQMTYANSLIYGNRTLANRFTDVYNVMDFGADNTGVADCFPAFTAAIAAAAAAGGNCTVVVPRGVYNFQTYADIPSPYGACAIYIDGIDNLTLLFQGANLTFSNIPSIGYAAIAPFNCTNFTMDGLVRVTGNRTGLAENVFNHAFMANAMVNMFVRGLTCDGQHQSLMGLSNVFDSVIYGLRGTNTVIGFDVAWLQNVLFDNIVISNGTVSGAPQNFSGGFTIFTDPATQGRVPPGYTFANGLSNNLLLTNSTFYGFANGISLDGVDEMRVTNTTVCAGVQNNADENYAGITAFTSTATINIGKQTQNIIIDSCTIFNTGNVTGFGGGIFLLGGDAAPNFVTIQNCQLYDNYTYGINAGSGALWVQFNNDYMTRNNSGVQVGEWSPLTGPTPTQFLAALQGPQPIMHWNCVNGTNPANETYWFADVLNGAFRLGMSNDAQNAFTIWMQAVRLANALYSLSIGDGGTATVFINQPTGTFFVDTQFLGVYGHTPVVQPTVTGSKGGNAALASLLTALAGMGLFVDSTT